MNAWHHLPNAKHIDRVLASFTANPRHWHTYIDITGEDDTPLDKAWKALEDTTNVGATHEYNASADVIYRNRRECEYECRYGAYSSIAMLISDQECAYMLDSDPGELEILAKFGDMRAVMLLPACKAFLKDKTVSV